MAKANLIKISSFATIIVVLIMLSLTNYVLAQDASESSETIREKVQEKLDAALKSPKAYIGSVTDIADSTIQINNLDDEIQQIIIDPEETTFVNVSEPSDEMEYSDVAIGDKIVAIGMVDENNTLNGLRILITSTEEVNERVIYNAEVISVEDRTILLNDFEKGEVVLTFPRAWKGPEIVDFNEGQKVAAVSINSDGVLTIRTIEILSEVENEDES